jgi:hypothetical protein
MRAVAGRQMRGLPQGARIDCVDNSGGNNSICSQEGKWKLKHTRNIYFTP